MARLGGTADGTAAAGPAAPAPARSAVPRRIAGPGPSGLQGSRRLEPEPVRPPAPGQGGNMRRHLRAAFAVLLAAAALIAAGTTATASAQTSAPTSGPESFTGFLV